MKEGFINITSGKIDNPTGLKKAIQSLPDGRYYWKLERKNKRSINQNSYIHGVLFPELAKAFIEQGYKPFDEEAAKDWAKRRFLTVRAVNEETGDVVEYTRKTSSLTTTELSEFIEDVIRFAAENLNYEIPMPGEQMRINA